MSPTEALTVAREALEHAFGALTYPVASEIDSRRYSLRIQDERVEFAAEELVRALKNLSVLEQTMGEGVITDEMVERALDAKPRNSPVRYFLGYGNYLTDDALRELMRAALVAALYPPRYTQADLDEGKRKADKLLQALADGAPNAK